MRQRDGRGEQRRRRADQAIRSKRRRRQGKEEMQPRGHVDAGGHHGRGVDQRAHRRRPGHGVRQPDEQWDLRRLAGGADKKQKRDQRNRRRTEQLHLLLQLDEIQSPHTLAAKLGDQ